MELYLLGALITFFILFITTDDTSVLHIGILSLIWPVTWIGFLLFLMFYKEENHKHKWSPWKNICLGGTDIVIKQYRTCDKCNLWEERHV